MFSNEMHWAHVSTVTQSQKSGRLRTGHVRDQVSISGPMYRRQLRSQGRIEARLEPKTSVKLAREVIVAWS